MNKRKRHSKVIYKKHSSHRQHVTPLPEDDARKRAFATTMTTVLYKALPKHSTAALKADSWLGEPVLHLCGVLRLVTKSLIRIAETGDQTAAAQIWEASSDLIKAIHSLAFQNPRVLKPIARKALFLPAFRAKTKRSFTHNFQLVREAIDLSKDCLINTGPEAQYELDSPTTFLVAAKLEAVGLIRERMKDGERDWKELARKRHLKITLDDWLVEFCGHNRAELFLKELPDYDQHSAPEWWEKVIKPYLAAPETLELLRVNNERFYRKLSASPRSKTQRGLVDQLMKSCKRQVLKSLAPPVALSPKL